MTPKKGDRDYEAQTFDTDTPHGTDSYMSTLLI